MLNGTGNTASFNMMNCPNSLTCLAAVNTGYTLTLSIVGKIGLITHNGGNVLCENVSSWNPTGGKIINSTSTSPLDAIMITKSNFTADFMNFGVISTTGATVIKSFNNESVYPIACLTSVSVINTVVGTTTMTLKAEVKKIETGISYNVSNGELTFQKTSIYNVSIDARIDCLEWDKNIEIWIEKWNGTSWVVFPESGLSRNSQNLQEVEINFSTRENITAGDKFRLRGQSDSATAMVLQTKTLDSTTKQPALRISISEVK